MTTAVVRALSPTRSRVLTVVVLLSMLFGFYGLLSAQQAHSAAGLSKQVWGGIRFDGGITHQKHITSVVYNGTGSYTITFDRHVDNCSMQVTGVSEGGGILTYSFLVQRTSATKVSVAAFNPDGSENPRDSDFDIFGMCPSS